MLLYILYVPFPPLAADVFAESGKIWPVIANFILVGHVQEVTDASTLIQCKINCLNAQADWGFVCTSGMWYPTVRTLLKSINSTLVYPNSLVVG